eukprot:849300-Pleurochrysis_carterae.AAC.3
MAREALSQRTGAKMALTRKWREKRTLILESGGKQGRGKRLMTGSKTTANNDHAGGPCVFACAERSTTSNGNAQLHDAFGTHGAED